MSDYRETKPAACESGVTCKTCTEDVVKIIFSPDSSATGVCGCRWTSWVFEPDGRVFRSTPRGFDP